MLSTELADGGNRLVRGALHHEDQAVVRVVLAEQVIRELNCEIDCASSWMVGDRPTDVLFGAGLGIQTALIRSPYWNPADLDCAPDLRLPLLNVVRLQP